jgi:methylglyoxal synthase
MVLVIIKLYKINIFRTKIKSMDRKKTIALVAHDHMKHDLIEWAEYNWNILKEHKLVCTGTTGRLIEDALTQKMKESKSGIKDLHITKLKSGPLGGDQQLGSMIADGNIDIMIFFWDPMLPQPHEVDVKALLRITVVYNIPTACNRSSADFMISSPLFNGLYDHKVKDYSDYLNRKI